MPSESIASQISNSLGEVEVYEDFAYLVDELTSLRAPYHDDLAASEGVAAKLLCIVVPGKPAPYTAAMQQFKARFAGISTDPTLQAEFTQSVQDAALKLTSLEPIVWDPSLYFSIPLASAPSEAGGSQTMN